MGPGREGGAREMLEGGARDMIEGGGRRTVRGQGKWVEDSHISFCPQPVNENVK